MFNQSSNRRRRTRGGKNSKKNKLARRTERHLLATKIPRPLIVASIPIVTTSPARSSFGSTTESLQHWHQLPLIGTIVRCDFDRISSSVPNDEPVHEIGIVQSAKNDFIVVALPTKDGSGVRQYKIQPKYLSPANEHELLKLHQALDYTG